jgi:hypothetical protein
MESEMKGGLERQQHMIKRLSKKSRDELMADKAMKEEELKDQLK